MADRSSRPMKLGLRLFAAGSIGLIVVAVLHTLGHFSSTAPDPAGAQLMRSMQEYRLDVGVGQQPSMWDVTQSLSLTMTIMLTGLGLIGLSIAALASEVPGVLRRMTLLNVLIVGALVVLFGVYRIVPPFVTLLAVLLLFVASLLVQRAGDTSKPAPPQHSDPTEIGDVDRAVNRPPRPGRS